jgi:alanine dehydrogenase
MKIAVLKEIKAHEYRVGLTPHCVREYCEHGHTIGLQTQAGQGAGYSDQEYLAAGATVPSDVAALVAGAEMVIKVKEPSAEEVALLHPGQLLFTYLHLAALPELTRSLLARGVTAIAYETIQLADGSLPCLQPMSEIAGRLAVQEGAKYLEKSFGGRGILLGGVPGVRRGRITILGGGTVGLNAAKIAVGIGAIVSVLDVSQRRLAYLDDIFGSRLQTLYSTRANLTEELGTCDLLIGAVLRPGARSPQLISRADLALMKPGAVIVDVAVDQGGCTETTRPTTHDQPIYVVDGIVHYCVSNMPGAVALTSTLALTSQTLAYGLALADHGLAAMTNNTALRHGLNLHRGQVTHQALAESLGLPYTDPLLAIAQ